ncbi:MAG: tetratricopeptide repeat protein, partial [Acidimicrobiales bacterium]
MTAEHELTAEDPRGLKEFLAHADALRRTGRVKEAVGVMEDVVTEYQAFAGADTPYALSLRQMLASLWVEDTSDHERVERARMLVSDCERVLGVDAPTTISARGELASLRAMAREDEGVLADQQRATVDLSKAIGDSASRSGQIRSALAARLFSMGRPGDAARELEILLAGAPPALDADPESARQVFRCLHLLARCYLALGRADDARALLERVVPESAQVLGPEAALTQDVATFLKYLCSYRGPVVTARADFGRRWIFVEDARVSPAERFAMPQARSHRSIPADGVRGALPVLDDEPNADDASDGEVDDVASTGAVDETVDASSPARHQPVLFDCVPGEVYGVEVRVIGPVEVVGWRDPGARATQLAEILCYLVLHRDRPVRGPALRLALRPDIDNEITEETLHAYVSMLRRAVGR